MTTIKDAIDDLFNNPQLTAQEAINRHFGPSFRQRSNGSWDDRPAFVARIVQLREVVEQVTVTVLDELIDAECYAERHIIDLIKRDGERIIQEVYVFAQFDADGRFARIEETTLVLEK
ncbi:hypothetical protein [Pseudomonas sp. LB3P25]